MARICQCSECGESFGPGKSKKALERATKHVMASHDYDSYAEAARHVDVMDGVGTDPDPDDDDETPGADTGQTGVKVPEFPTHQDDDMGGTTPAKCPECNDDLGMSESEAHAKIARAGGEMYCENCGATLRVGDQ